MMNIQLMNAIQTEKANRNVLLSRHPEHNQIIALHYSESCIFNKRWNQWNIQFRDMVVNEATGEILARPISKFFNQRHWAAEGKEFPEGVAEITEKLDGVRVTTFPFQGKMECVSEGKFVCPATHTFHELWNTHFSHVELPAGKTLTFELIHPDHQVVIPYEETRIVLVAAVDNETGEDYIYDQLAAVHESLQAQVTGSFGFGLIKRVENKTLADVLEEALHLPWNKEGYVVRIGNIRIKVKSAAYLEVFQITHLMSDKQKYEAWANGQLDTFINSLPDVHKDKLVSFQTHLNQERTTFVQSLYRTFEEAPKDDRKTFALWVKDRAAKELKLLFDLLDKRLSEETVRQHMFLQYKKVK